MKSVLEFEKKYRDILEDMEEWIYLRFNVGLYLKNRDNIKKETKKFKWQDKLLLLYRVKDIFYGFKNWFGRYDYIFISNSSQRKEIEGEAYHTQFDYIIESLGADKSLLIEEPTPSHFQNSYTENIVSYSMFALLSRFIPIKGVDFQEIDKLKELFSSENITINIKAILKDHREKFTLSKWLLKLYRPKILFISCGYCKIDIVKSAKELNILVVEVQHGVVNEVHFGYTSPLLSLEKHYPDIFLSWGMREMKINNFLTPKVTPIGSYYLEYIKESFQKNRKLSDIIEPYSLVIGVTMQDEDWEFYTLCDVLEDLAQQFTSVVFVIIPRRRDEFHFKEKNIIVWRETDCYQTIMHCDMHLTLYSTCAIEVPSLNVPNLLLNHNNMAQIYYGDVLSSENTTIGDINLLKERIESFSQLKSDKIAQTNSESFVNGYRKNIEKIVKREFI